MDKKDKNIENLNYKSIKSNKKNLQNEKINVRNDLKITYANKVKNKSKKELEINNNNKSKQRALSCDSMAEINNLKLNNFYNKIIEKCEEENIITNNYLYLTQDNLHKFWRANDGKIEEAVKHLFNVLKWRQENNVDNIREWKSENYEKIQKIYPFFWYSIHPEGYPIFLDFSGQIKIRELEKITSINELIKIQTQLYEFCNQYLFNYCSSVSGKGVRKFITVVDLNGFKITKMGTKVYSFLKQMCSISQKNYPENLHRIYIINNSNIFKIVWKMISPWINSVTKKKVFFLGTNYQEKLFQDIPQKCFPPEIGGTGPSQNELEKTLQNHFYQWINVESKDLESKDLEL